MTLFWPMACEQKRWRSHPGLAERNLPWVLSPSTLRYRCIQGNYKMERTWVPEALLERRASRPSGTANFGLYVCDKLIICCGEPLPLGGGSSAAASISLTASPPANTSPCTVHGGDWGHTGNASEGDAVLAIVIGDLSHQAKAVTLSTVPSSELTVSAWGLPAPRSLPSLWPRADRLSLPLISRFDEWKVSDRCPQGNESRGGGGQRPTEYPL